MDDSTFEFVPNPGMLSDDDGGRTVSVASQSVDGDTADDFSSINSNAGYSSDEYDGDIGDELNEGELPGQARPSPLSGSSSLHHSTLGDDDVEDSGMTAKPIQAPLSLPQGPTDRPPRLDDGGNNGDKEHRVKTAQRSKGQDMAQADDSLGLWSRLKNYVGALKSSPLARSAMGLPWLWILGLALVNITAIYAATTYMAVRLSPSVRLPADSSSRPLSATWTAHVTTTHTVTLSSTALALPPTAATARSWADRDRKLMEKMRKHFDDVWEKEGKDRKRLGRTLSTDLPDGKGFLLIGYGDSNGFFILSPPSLATKDAAIVVSATRGNSPVKFDMTKLRRGLHYVRLAAEDAHGAVDFLIKTGSKPFKYQHQRVDFGSSWLPLTIQPSSWADAANKMVELFKGEVLTLEAVTKDVSVWLGLMVYNRSQSISRGSRELAESALQRLDDTAKELMKLPRHTWANTAKVQHELLSAQRKMAKRIAGRSNSVARLIGYNSRVVRNGVGRAYQDLYKAISERIPSADLSLPLRDPAKALKNAQSNARDIFGRLSAAKATLKQSKGTPKRNGWQMRRGEQKAKRKACPRAERCRAD